MGKVRLIATNCAIRHTTLKGYWWQKRHTLTFSSMLNVGNMTALIAKVYIYPWPKWSESCALDLAQNQSCERKGAAVDMVTELLANFNSSVAFHAGTESEFFEHNVNNLNHSNSIADAPVWHRVDIGLPEYEIRADSQGVIEYLQPPTWYYSFYCLTHLNVSDRTFPIFLPFSLSAWLVWLITACLLQTVLQLSKYRNVQTRQLRSFLLAHTFLWFMGETFYSDKFVEQFTPEMRVRPPFATFAELVSYFENQPTYGQRHFKLVIIAGSQLEGFVNSANSTLFQRLKRLLNDQNRIRVQGTCVNATSIVLKNPNTVFICEKIELLHAYFELGGQEDVSIFPMSDLILRPIYIPFISHGNSALSNRLHRLHHRMLESGIIERILRHYYKHGALPRARGQLLPISLNMFLAVLNVGYVGLGLAMVWLLGEYLTYKIGCKHKILGIKTRA